MNEFMLIAAEACYELDPCPIHEAWLEKVWKEQEKNKDQHGSIPCACKA